MSSNEYEYGGIDDKEFGDILSYLQTGNFPNFDDQTNVKYAKDSFRRKVKSYSLGKEGSGLYFTSKKGQKKKVVRKGQTKSVIQEAYDLDHRGINTTMDRLSNHYWRHMWADVEHFIAVCERCQKSARFENTSVPLHPVPPPQRPFQMWGMDLTALPKTAEGHCCLVVACDYMSKFVEAAPLTTKGADGVLDFFDTLCSRYGFPRIIVTDNGKEFCNSKFTDYCRENGIEHRTSASYHPQVCL